MRQSQTEPQATLEAQRPPTVEDLNRAAAARRACLREGVEWIEDDRSPTNRNWLHSLALH
jgi:hypothetical protein